MRALEKGDLPLFPAVIDTQSGQDDPNLGRMFNIATHPSGAATSSFVAMEPLPAEATIEGFEMQTIETPHGV
ncbi:hypothetical protein EN871_11340 [bacterium M00.F.Ca.ET.228.01.1.1]|uniref:hypothetical protein n=1 Tax=Paraburkholderia phenoliruptrix TaxID=252970 RepID=UPI001092D270|nr:hypothetical protein [Paraburkholderia phenoliruptrix]TGP45153.1 hypothetical protein EN871_11340 [bacterium M00.F.Ca.ET.228.01.1.1]TGS03036.1 hypothetical protein EN834_11335 [bacterium M00.F.Ca.ET.191.01.1.1]TGU06418.1 hypothetical protein EN798_15415 [bacterium M00.F.Ca.ET.155.01.1.1]MBW0448789.1 hypothetical protein [Paraburkholderia phenoliruptrix]MBW9097766.1 hypothetical protein [Paraburkholderia phenoliruptrix]